MLRLNAARKNILVLTGALLLSFLLYFPLLNHTFLSDDYDSLYRIIIKKDILVKDFLRPLIDLSFYFNYALSGLNATGFYAFNIVVHALNTWLLYRVAKRYVIFEAREQETFACMATVLFLVYPFHSESIVWLSGRLSSIACLCALIALDITLSNAQPWKKNLLAIIVYLIGLHAYESILLLPFIIIAWQWKKGRSWRSLVSQGVLWGIVMALYLSWRYFISGVVYGGYAERVVDNRLIKYFNQGLKTLGRSVLPPAENSQLITVLFCCVAALLILLHYYLYRKLQMAREWYWKYGQLVIAFLIAILVPVLFGVSTRTTEGDRLLYFPSCFLCLLLSFWLLVLLKKNSYRWAVIALLIIGSLGFTIPNNNRWAQASDLTKEVHKIIGEAGDKQIVLINLPEELEGAFAFRNAFYNSLLVQGVDTSRVTVTHYLSRLEYLAAKDEIAGRKEQERWFIYPATYIIDNQNGVVEIKGPQNEYIASVNKKNSIIYYWNNRRMVKLF